VKTRTAIQRTVKPHRLTLGEARQAARAAKGSRPTGTFIVLESGKARALRKRYLGEIVRAYGKSGSSSRVASANGASSKHAVTGKVAKKK
jgi:hypothetical protein